MRKVILGKTGVKVPAVSLGTWSHGGLKFAGKSSVGWAGQEERNSYDALVKAWELGITHWDTADVYLPINNPCLMGEKKQTPALWFSTHLLSPLDS